MIKIHTTTECPECRCKEYQDEDTIGEGYRVCSNCRQEWWTDINYEVDEYED